MDFLQLFFGIHKNACITALFFFVEMGEKWYHKKKGGEEMSENKIMSTFIKSALKEKGMTQKELAAMLGIDHQTLRNRLYRGSFSVDSAVDILNRLGYEIIAVDKETKKPLL